MPTSTATLKTTAFPMANGVDNVDPRGATYKITFGGTWAPDETWEFNITSTIGDLTLGFGNITQSPMTNGFVLNQKVYLASGDKYNFSAVEDPTGWEIQNIGAGFNPFTTQYGVLDSVNSFAAYQGLLAVFGRRSIQIWQVDADPNNYVLKQTLNEDGTVSYFSPGGLGQLEILYLGDTGFRSVRSRDITLDAYVTDLGSPIDSTVVNVLQGLTDAQKATACAVVEPSSKRYWCYLSGVIYSLSNFPTSKVVAWSTYDVTYVSSVDIALSNDALAVSFTGGISLPTVDGSSLSIQNVTGATAAIVASTIAALINLVTATYGYSASVVGGTITIASINNTPLSPVLTLSSGLTAVVTPTNTAFIPYKFLVYKGQVIGRSADAGYLYGGLTNLAYDGTVPLAEISWLDLKQPGKNKVGQKVNVAMSGGWTIKCGLDPRSGDLNVYVPLPTTVQGSVTQDSTFNEGSFAFDAQGTHFKFRATGDPSWAQGSILSGFTLQYNIGENV